MEKKEGKGREVQVLRVSETRSSKGTAVVLKGSMEDAAKVEATEETDAQKKDDATKDDATKEPKEQKKDDAGDVKSKSRKHGKKKKSSKADAEKSRECASRFEYKRVDEV